MRVCSVTTLALAASLGMLAGCETTDIAKGPQPPAVALGPEFEAARAERYTSKVAGVLARDGRAHLIVAYPVKRTLLPDANASGARTDVVCDVRHLVIGPQGVESSELVQSGIAQSLASDNDALHVPDVDLAFDRAGLLHAIVGREHLVLKDGAWQGRQRTPWDEAKLKATNAGFVHDMPGLVWYFTVANGDIGLPDEQEGDAATSDGKPHYIEYRTYERMLVAPEDTPYRRFFALPMEDTNGYTLLGMGADARQAIHVYYFPDKPHYDAPDTLRYAVFRVDAPCPPAPAAPPGKERPAAKLANGTPVCQISGSSVTPETPPLATPAQAIAPRIHIGPRKFALLTNSDIDMGFAMDADSGAILLTGGNIYSILAGTSAKSRVAKVPATDAGLLPAAAGNNRFHALLTGVEGFTLHPSLYYLAYADGTWSAPVEVGTYSYHYFGWPDPTHMRGDAFRIIGDGHGRALLLWPYDDTLRARWVTLK